MRERLRAWAMVVGRYVVAWDVEQVDNRSMDGNGAL
jgi:hypothetical protein